MRTTVRELVDGILSTRIEIRRPDHHRFHDEAVARVHLQKLWRRELVLRERVDDVRVNDSELTAVGAMETDLWRGHDRAPPIEVVGEVRTELRVMRAGGRRKALEA